MTGKQKLLSFVIPFIESLLFIPAHRSHAPSPHSSLLSVVRFFSETFISLAMRPAKCERSESGRSGTQHRSDCIIHFLFSRTVSGVWQDENCRLMITDRSSGEKPRKNCGCAAETPGDAKRSFAHCRVSSEQTSSGSR